MAIKTQDNYMVRCKANSAAPLQHFFINAGSIIYHKCSCGQTCSYENSNAHKHYKEHYDVFKLHLKPTKDISKDWDKYFDEIKRVIESDPLKYQITWDTLRVE
jgi:hypothetical protein